ncbi:YkgJ family cysteine cluster protein [Catalinimonas niigatensis]|uniref:YkgJ family cysteine cluster protein n=1 Tax=Catalinimonas niigatensis TaxID=1397264 RepID=UPI0026669781|nr:YkgJ family cysteine cluster protein [Catalinimonas niigatensis]WPP51568.1 YkgJ family cysteine cluster protein [Catalinimonas niigatensis]
MSVLNFNMSIKRKVKAVEKLYSALDQEMQLFSKGTGMHCLTGCGKCCFKPDIEATILEFLPFAYHLFINKQAEEWLEKISTYKESQVCAILQALGTDQKQGKCSSYPHRGLICRLFGFSAAFDKYGERRLSTCNVIKTELPEIHSKADAWVKEGQTTPVMRNYYYRLCNIEPRLTDKFYPINKAIGLAIEEVLAYYSYRSLPRAS